MMATTKTPTLQLVPRARPKRPKRGAGGLTQDIAAWGLVVDALEEALRLTLSDHVRKRMVRTHALTSRLARRPLLRDTAGGA
jgi:hypothetical protein